MFASYCQDATAGLLVPERRRLDETIHLSKWSVPARIGFRNFALPPVSSAQFI